MAEVKWIKIATDIFDDEKIILIESLPEAHSIITVWFKLLCLAGKQNNSGVFMMSNKKAYTERMLATILRMDEEIIKLAIQTFEDFGMIEIIDGVITISNWNKHQSLDTYEKKKERDRLYQAERRANQKALIKKSSDNRLTVARQSVDASSDIAVSEVEEEKEKDKEEEKEVEVDVEVIESADAPDYSDCDNKLQFFNGSLMFSENQITQLIDIMGLEMFDDYCARLSLFIENTGATVKSHYQTILKWYNEDRAMKPIKQ